MKPWKEHGCESCRRAWERVEPPPELAVNIPMHARLRRCPICHSYWREEERYAVQIDEAEARRDFPEAFSN
jgi:hypothetical protein